MLLVPFFAGSSANGSTGNLLSLPFQAPVFFVSNILPSKYRMSKLSFVTYCSQILVLLPIRPKVYYFFPWRSFEIINKPLCKGKLSAVLQGPVFIPKESYCFTDQFHKNAFVMHFGDSNFKLSDWSTTSSRLHQHKLFQSID